MCVSVRSVCGAMSGMFVLALASPATATLNPGDFVFITDDAVGVRPWTAWGEAAPQWTVHASGISWVANIPEPTVVGQPSTLLYTQDGRLLVATHAPDGRIFDVTAGGSSVASTTPFVWSSISGFGRLLATRDGRILVSVYTDGTVRDVTAGGYLQDLPVFASGLDVPYGLIQTADGRILVTEEEAGEVTDITAGGDFSNSAPYASGLTQPIELVQKRTGEIIVMSEWGHSARDITNGAVPVYFRISYWSEALDFSFGFVTSLFCDETNVMWAAVESYEGDPVPVAGVAEIECCRGLLDDTKARQIIQLPHAETGFERRDYAEPGDGLIAFDPVTGMEWLSPVVTYDEWLVAFDIPGRDAFDNEYNQTAPPTNDFYARGWRHAARAELHDFFSRTSSGPGYLGAERNVSGLLQAWGVEPRDPYDDIQKLIGARGFVRQDLEIYPGVYFFDIAEYSYALEEPPHLGPVVSNVITSMPGFLGAGATEHRTRFDVSTDDGRISIRVGHFLVREAPVLPSLDFGARWLVVAVLVATGIMAAARWREVA